MPISTSTSPNPALAALALLTLCSAAWSADAPTQDEWEPVHAAIQGGSPDALDRLGRLVARYPRWADGHSQLANLNFESKRYDLSLTSANRALALDPTLVQAACLEIEDLSALKRYAEIWPAVDACGAGDKGGWVHFYAARAAQAAGEAARAERLLQEAFSQVPNSAPLDFYILAARLDVAKQDLDGARSELDRATRVEPGIPAAWYELGRIELEEAGSVQAQSPDHAKELVDQAEGHLARAKEGLSEDANVLYGLGYARYEQAKRLLADDPDRGSQRLRDAEPVLEQATQKQPAFGLAHYVLGNVEVQLEKWPEAITHLERARTLGTMDRPGLFNLALAYERMGDRAQAKAILANNPPTSVGEEVMVAMGAYHDHDFPLAAKLLEAVAPELAAEPERQAAALRYIGHAHREIAARAEQAAGGGGEGGVDRAAELDAAADAYRRAGDLHDHVAQENYLALETARGSAWGFPAAWRFIRWHGGMTLTGWCAWVGNYGGWLTGGAGVGGAWKRHPAATIVWGALLGLPLLFSLIALVRRPAAYNNEPREPAAEADARAKAAARTSVPTPRRNAALPASSPPRPKSDPSATRGTSGLAPSRRSDATPLRNRVATPRTEPTPLRNRIQSPKPKTEPTPRGLRAPIDNQKTETEEMPKPEQRDGSGKNALERKPRQ